MTIATATTITATMVFNAVATVLMIASIGMSIYSMLSASSGPAAPVPAPNAVGGIPTAEEGRPIPVVFGTRILSQPNVVWWGNTHNTPNEGVM